MRADMTSELCGWVGEGKDDGVVNVLALFRPDDATERGAVNERHSSEVVRARRIGEQADADMTFNTKTLQKNYEQAQ